MYKLLKNIYLCVFGLFLALSLLFVPKEASGASYTALDLPEPGAMVGLSEHEVPVLLRGLSVNPKDPLEFDFIIDSGTADLSEEEIQEESNKLIKYFLTGLTVPDQDLWVNLSPYESERIIPEKLGQTTLGQELLAQDYLLKQLTATIIYPEEELGDAFWERVYEKVGDLAQGQDIPLNTFNKVWIVPERAVVYEHANTVYVSQTYLKVLTEKDYLALDENRDHPMFGDLNFDEPQDEIKSHTADIMRELIIPEIEREVNHGATFAPLRQIYNSLILARWYKQSIQNAILDRLYVNRNRTLGVRSDHLNLKDEIYERYVSAFEQGVFDYIKEDYDANEQALIPRKYFSGGIPVGRFSIDRQAQEEAELAPLQGRAYRSRNRLGPDMAMLAQTEYTVLEQINLSGIAEGAGLDFNVVQLLNPEIGPLQILEPGTSVRLYTGDIRRDVESLEVVLPGKKVLVFDNDQFMSWPVIDISSEDLKAIIEGEKPMPDKYKLNNENFVMLRKFLEQGGVLVIVSGGDVNNNFLRVADLFPPELQKRILIAHNGGKQVFGFLNSEAGVGEPIVDFVDQYFQERGISDEVRARFENAWMNIVDDTIEFFNLDKFNIEGFDTPIIIPEVRVDRRYSLIGYERGNPVQVTFELDVRQDYLAELPLAVRQEFDKRINQKIMEYNSAFPEANIPFVRTANNNFVLAQAIKPYLEHRYNTAEEFEYETPLGIERIPVGSILGGGGGIGALDSGIGKAVAKGFAVSKLFNDGIIRNILGRQLIDGSEILIGDDNPANAVSMYRALQENVLPEFVENPEAATALVTPKMVIRADAVVFSEAQMEGNVVVVNDEFCEDCSGLTKYMIAESMPRLEPTASTINPDGAAVGDANTKGGIDFQDFTIEKTGDVIELEFNPILMQNIMNQGVDGFVPHNIEFVPIQNIYPLLGIEDPQVDPTQTLSLNN